MPAAGSIARAGRRIPGTHPPSKYTKRALRRGGVRVIPALRRGDLRLQPLGVRRRECKPPVLKLMGASSSRKCGSLLLSGGLRVGGDAWERRDLCLLWWGRGMVAALSDHSLAKVL